MTNRDFERCSSDYESLGIEFFGEDVIDRES